MATIQKTYLGNSSQDPEVNDTIDFFSYFEQTYDTPGKQDALVNGWKTLHNRVRVLEHV